MTAGDPVGSSGRGVVTIELKLIANFQEIVGEKSIERSYQSRPTIGTVLADLEARYPALDGRLLDDGGRLGDAIAVVRNGRNVAHLDDVDTALDHGDELGLMPPVVGWRDPALGVAQAAVELSSADRTSRLQSHNGRGRSNGARSMRVAFDMTVGTRRVRFGLIRSATLTHLRIVLNRFSE